MNKPVRVILLDEADAEYKRLNEIVGQQLQESKCSTEEIRLLRSINQKIEFVKANRTIVKWTILFSRSL